MLLPPLPKNLAGIVLVAFLALLSGCDALEQLSGADPVDTVVRDNPVDPQSSRPLVFGLDSPDPFVATVRPSVRFSLGNGVASYSLQIATTAEFESPLAYQENGIAEEIHRIATPLENKGKYFWRVRPRFSGGNEGGWSEIRELEIELPVPVAVEPTTTGDYASPYPMFYFHSPSAQMSIELQVASDPGFITGVIDSGSFNFDQTNDYDWFKSKVFFQDGQTYFWRARILDDGVHGDWGASRSFKVVLPTITREVYTDDKSLHPPITLSWNLPWPGVPDSVLTQLAVSPMASFPEGETRYIVSSTGSALLQLPLALMTQYYWRVRASYPTGEFGPWSSVGTFFRDPVGEVIPGFLGPFLRAANGSLIGYQSSPLGLSQWDPVAQSFDWGNARSSYSGSLIAVGSNGSIYELALDPWTSDAAIGIYNSSGRSVVTFPMPHYDRLVGFALASDGTLYFETANLNGSFYEYWLFALAANGSLQWKVKVPTSEWSENAPTVNSNGQILLCHDTEMFRFASDGTLDSTSDWAGSSPILSVDDAMYSVGYNQAVTAQVVRSWDTNGNLNWSKEVFRNGENPVVDSDGTVYLCIQEAWNGPTFLVALNSDGSTKWKTPLPWLDYLLLGSDDTIYGTSARMAVALEREYGTPKWSIPLDNYSPSRMNILTDGTLVIPNSDDVLLIPTAGLDQAAPWPMANHDPQGTRNASY